MKTKKILIAGGNSTLLVWDCPPEQKKDMVNTFLREVEQIGFVSSVNGIPKLSMMGNELCVNATLALSSVFGENGFLQTSGGTQKLSYTNIGKITCINLTLPFKKFGNIILFKGIGFILSDRYRVPSKKYLSSLAEKYSRPAFGFITYTKSFIKPYVYVKKTNSLFAETACGSGSIALNIMTGIEKIIQPSGGVIVVQRTEDQFEVSANIMTIPLSKDLKNDIFR